MEKERRGSEEVGEGELAIGFCLSLFSHSLKRPHRRQISLFYYHFRCYLVLSLDNQC